MCGSQDTSMIGQGSCLKALSPPAAPSAELCGIEVLGTPFTTSSCMPAPVPALPLPTPGELRCLAKPPHPTHLLKCPRCDSLDTKFCYYNNYSLSQPRYFCKNCKRYWTAGGALRNVAVGGGLRKNKRWKLKLQAEAEAAAAAALAQDLATREASDRPDRTASSGAIGGSSTSCTSSATVVSGVPANFAMNAAPAMIRTSSGSDESTVEYAGSDICGSTGAAAAHVMRMDPGQQNGNLQLQHFFGELCAHAVAVPQFYSSYSTSLSPSNLQQYGSAITKESSAAPASYHAVGYVNQLVQSNSSTSMNLYSSDKGGAAAMFSNPAHAHNYSNGGAAYHVGSEAGGDMCSNELKEEEEEIVNANPQYDWLLISETLYNGAAAEGFLPLPGGSWPDFSQFQDPSGPG